MTLLERLRVVWALLRGAEIVYLADASDIIAETRELRRQRRSETLDVYYWAVEPWATPFVPVHSYDRRGSSLGLHLSPVVPADGQRVAVIRW